MINKLNLNEQIYETLRKEIFTNQIESGSLLVNKDLQEKFEVSSSPIRDAINRLEQDGLISKITRAGARVIQLNYEKTREINELMSIISTGAITLAIKSPRKTKLDKELKKLLKIQEENLYTDEYFFFDYQFHKLFFEYSNNSLLFKVYKQYNVLSELAVRSLDNVDQYRLSKENRRTSLEGHKLIVDYFVNNDLENALHTIKQHYQYADETFKKYYK